ncbi:hypothetical protein DWW86_01745 [Ruminococcus sp. AF17-22AC]|jgi:hypothetical protein|uniref:hypothetical protein n=1 Tax=Ruminococcus sp. AF17-22AC TaxID=2292248 RepID=UPI000E470CBE|nr:hypothetical protein [Ruminococcus sp. AF17-22AC]RGU34910.1 hypothetical protein DWW86_01745 [Ruminococcus sp. AF17-22AC]
MLIRSQNKKYLVSTNNITFYVMDSEVICFGISGIEDSDYIILGHYETEAKAMKVLDMIQEVYEEYKITCTFLTGFTGHRAIVESNDIRVNGFEELIKSFKKNMVFQMPEDLEVEV